MSGGLDSDLRAVWRLAAADSSIVIRFEAACRYPALGSAALALEFLRSYNPAMEPFFERHYFLCDAIGMIVPRHEGLDLLSSPFGEIRAAGVEILRRSAQWNAAPEVTLLLDDEDCRVVAEALRFLANAGVRVPTPACLAIIRRFRGSAVAEAARTLARQGAVDAVPAMLAAADSGNALELLCAAAQLDFAAAEPAILRRIGRFDTGGDLIAVIALARLRDHARFDVLLRAIKGLTFNGDTENDRELIDDVAASVPSDRLGEVLDTCEVPVRAFVSHPARCLVENGRVLFSAVLHRFPSKTVTLLALQRVLDPLRSVDRRTTAAYFLQPDCLTAEQMGYLTALIADPDTAPSLKEAILGRFDAATLGAALDRGLKLGPFVAAHIAALGDPELCALLATALLDVVTDEFAVQIRALEARGVRVTFSVAARQQFPDDLILFADRPVCGRLLAWMRGGCTHISSREGIEIVTLDEARHRFAEMIAERLPKR